MPVPQFEIHQVGGGFLLVPDQLIRKAFQGDGGIHFIDKPLKGRERTEVLMPQEDEAVELIPEKAAGTVRTGGRRQETERGIL